MRKITSILMLLMLCVGASWAQTTENILLSTNVANPEHVYYMKNGNGLWMTATSGPTVTWGNQAKFAFFAGDKKGVGEETAVKIYCVTANKWLSFTEAASYNNGINFVSMADTKDAANSWGITTQDGNGNLSTVYQFAPYNSTGLASKYMNWYNGADSNPNDNTNITVGLYGTGATGDNGSCWILVDVNYGDIANDQKMVRIKQVSDAAVPVYLTIVSPNGTNHDNGGIELGAKVAESNAGCMNQIYYLKSQNSDGVCKIQTISRDGYYLQTFGSWGYKAATTSGDAANHIIEPVNDYYLLHEDKGYVGPNANQFTAGSKIYSNQDAEKNSIKWVFEALTEAEVLAATQHVIAQIQAEYAAWVAEYEGTNFGQYYVAAENQDAFNTAKAALDGATTIAGAEEAMNTCKNLHSLHGLVAGNYYRIENTAMDNYYLGLNGTSLNMKHNKVADEATYDNNPGIIWQYVEEGDKAYMKNVYAGLYPQNIPSGQSSTATIGIGKEKAFTYALHTARTETAEPKWNIFFGGTQVNCEGSDGNKGNVNYWYGDNAHYYIYEVESAPTDDFASMCATWYTANPKTDEDVSGVEKIEVDPAATEIISPNEFASPLVINNVIDTYKDKLNMTGEATQEKVRDMFTALANWSVVRTYQSAVNQHGSLLSFAYTPQVEYGTIILPINWAKPAGWTINSCSAKDAATNVLTLVSVQSGVKNKPYIVQFAEDKIGITYQFIGYSNDAATTNQTEGWLTGVLEENFYVPAGCYILSKDKNDPNSKLGFYKVAEDNVYKAAKNRCYLTVPAADPASRFEALFFENDDIQTGINSVNQAQTKQSGIYNIAGQRLSKLQKGLNIVNGKKVIVK